MRLPPQVKYVVGAEACERFAFHGMRSILTVYMLQGLLFPERDAKAWFHAFVVASHLTPLLGAWIAERFWGRYRTILWISFAYVAGHAVLAAWPTELGLLVGCALVAMGAGGIGPSVSAFAGDQLGPDPRDARRRIDGWFHGSIHLGSASAYLVVPELLRRHGPSVAFAVPGVLMAVALLVFWAGSRHYVRAAPSGPDPHSFLRVVGRAVKRLGTGRPGEHWLDGARDAHPAPAVDGAKAVFRVMGVFGAVTVFWALFDQKASSWVIQASQLDRVILGEERSPAAFQVFNPVFVMALVPLLTWVVFPFLQRRGVSLAPLRKMTWGMLLTATSFAAAAILQAAIDGAGAERPSVLWQLPQYLLLTVGEILVSVTGLEFGCSQAPRTMRSTILSTWFLAVALGNLLTAVIVKLTPLSGAANPWLFAGLMLLAALAFRFVARRYRYVEGTAPGA